MSPAAPNPDSRVHVRALLIALGLYAAAALVWFLGPLLTIAGQAPLASERARGAAIAAVLALYAAQALVRTLRAARANRRLLDGLVGGMPRAAAATGDAVTPGASEVALLGKRFDDAVRVLRSRRLGPPRGARSLLARRPYVYELPWYLLIGAPGAGKTTTIVNSGLGFPLADGKDARAIAGVGGTRHCDWWFTDEAVLIDTAGRYTTQDSYRDADRAAWHGFLDLLARHRPRQPINGVIVALSVSDLLQPSPDKRAALVRETRARLDELQQRLAIRFPVYLLVTKTDLLAGFAEFFADYDKDERAQVWGVTFPLDDDASDRATRPPRPESAGPLGPARVAGRAWPALGAFTTELTALEKSLNDQLFDRLRDERDRERRAAIFAFPQQWRVLREALVETVHATFDAASPERAPPLLRGVYFTSATQEGSPVDRALGGLARAMGLAHRVLPAARGSGKSFFVTRLLRDVVIGEAGVAGTNRAWERRRTLAHAGAVTLAAVAGIGALGVVYRLQADGLEWLARSRAATAAMLAQAAPLRAAAATDLAPLVPVLDALHALERDARGDRRAGAAWAAIGLDPRGSVAAVAQDVYHQLLRDGLLPRVAAGIERQLAAARPEQVESIYDALKAYLMLFGGRHFDAVALRAFLAAEWDGAAGAPLPAALKRALREHLDRLLATGEVGAPSRADATLVARTRHLVAAVPLVDRVYSRLRQSAATLDGAGAWSIESLAGAPAAKVLQRAGGASLAEPVTALYGAALRRQGLAAQVQGVLRQFDQEAAWVLQPERPTALDDAARAQIVQQIEARHAAESQRYWEGLLRELRLVPAKGLAAVAEQAQILSRPDSPLLAVIQAVLREAGPDGGREFYAALRAYALGQPPAWEPVHATLGRLATQLVAIDDALARQATPPSHDALRELADAASRTPEPVRGLLQQLQTQAAAVALGALREPLQRQLAAEVATVCQRAVDARYPFVRGAAQEAARDDFARVFAPGAAIDGYVRRQLAGLVELPPRPGATPLAADTAQSLQRADAIRRAFFGEGAGALEVRLQMRLLDIDPGLAALQIDVDGHTLRFARDSRGPQTLAWPGPAGTGRLTLQALAPGAAEPSSYRFDGAWSLLRLFERVRVEPGATAQQATMVFDVEGRRARFEVRSAGGPLPFALELDQFQCPRRLL